MRHPLRSAIDLFRSKRCSMGWGVAAVAFALHVAALTLAQISIGQAVLAAGLIFLAVLAERHLARRSRLSSTLDIGHPHTGLEARRRLREQL
ncbi:MAG TPA: hypothetical protein VI006_09770 [Solirubrobacteraceae bacterium]